MTVGKTFDEIVVDDIRKTPEFARGLLGEAVMLLVEGDTATAKITLRNLVNGTIGFKTLGEVTGINDKSLHRMLGPNGNPTLDNFASITRALKDALCAEVQVRVVAA
jgi:DNA-binding phage protein